MIGFPDLGVIKLAHLRYLYSLHPPATERLVGELKHPRLKARVAVSGLENGTFRRISAFGIVTGRIVPEDPFCWDVRPQGRNGFFEKSIWAISTLAMSMAMSMARMSEHGVYVEGLGELRRRTQFGLMDTPVCG